MGVCIAKLCALTKVTKHTHTHTHQRKTSNSITMNVFTSNSKSNSKHAHTHKHKEKKKKEGTNLGNKSIRVNNGRRVNEGRACLV